MESALADQAGVGSIADEAARRRTFAIVSHPDAGKTTTTEKLLLYAGAVLEAGSVDARAGRRNVTSDWMEFERRRGISITTTAISFRFDGRVFNLLDTPGHHEFSEDTLRVMEAADCAIVVLDASRGIETQTARVLGVARHRGLPIMFFVNKCDRPGLEPLGLLDGIERTTGIPPAPLNWPVGDPGELRGLIVREGRTFLRFHRSPRGATQAGEEVLSIERARAEEGEAWERAEEELELVEHSGLEFDLHRFHAGEQAPVVFGSSAWNFGISTLLATVAEIAPAPTPRAPTEGVQRPLDAPFAGFVFKVQANMDPRHRDNLAFVRICSGEFERGMAATNARTGKSISLSYPHQLFGREREIVDRAWPGDVIGVVNASELQVGDSLFSAEPVTFPPLPRMEPTSFALASNRDAQRYRQFRRGLEQLAGEGLIQIVRRGRDDPQAILAGLGTLQFEAVSERMAAEFGVRLVLEPLPFRTARRMDTRAAAAWKDLPGSEVFVRKDGDLLVAFRHEFDLRRLVDRNSELVLAEDDRGEWITLSEGRPASTLAQ